MWGVDKSEDRRGDSVKETEVEPDKNERRRVGEDTSEKEEGWWNVRNEERQPRDC